MALDIQIQNLLRSNDVRDINFRFGGVLVSGHGFWEVSNRISDRPIRSRIRITVRPQLVRANADATYDPVDDKIHLRSNTVMNTAAGQGQVVHECTHAQIDYRSTSASIRSEESAAFIAEAWFLLATRRLAISSIDWWVSQEIRTIAQNLSQQYHARSQFHVIDVSNNQINIARRAITRMGYGNGHYTSDGIRSRRLRITPEERR